MTSAYTGEELAAAIQQFAPSAVVTHRGDSVWIDPAEWLDVANDLRGRSELDFNYLSLITGVDFIDHFEVVYHLTSMAHNRSAVIKLRCGAGRVEPSVSSVYSVWRGADLQEREIWDLMGIRFEGHPNLKRIMLWEGFSGFPLRKDYLR